MTLLKIILSVPVFILLSFNAISAQVNLDMDNEYRSVELDGFLKIYEDVDGVELGYNVKANYLLINNLYLIAGYDSRNLKNSGFDFKTKVYSYGAGIRTTLLQEDDVIDLYAYFEVLQAALAVESESIEFLHAENSGYEVGAGYRIITPRTPNIVTNIALLMRRYYETDFELSDISYAVSLGEYYTPNIQLRILTKVGFPFYNPEIGLGIKAVF
ncbi:hypothetical protein [Marinicellulosiphila megalodicopiae]|uniref:hypothetical protein n=1 Tax=Marinicellulosiphila megalodicopiae TaxID=2724896 RepID=UPI003BB1C496